MGSIGYKLTSGSGGWYEVNDGNNNQRALTVARTMTMPTNGYITRIGAWARRDQNNNGGRPKIWYGIYETSSNGEPGRLLAHTGRMEVGNNGQDISGDLVWVNPALGLAAHNALIVNAGQLLSIGFKVEAERTQIASVGPQATHYYRSYGTQGVPPSDPFNVAGNGTFQELSLYADWVENLAPTAIQSGPANGAALNPQAVVFSGLMADPYGPDRMTAFAIEVSRASDNAVLWNYSSQASAAERASNGFSRAYQGLFVLEPGEIYRWRIAVADQHGAWSASTGYRTFTINPRGQVSVATETPNGKLENDASAISYFARWHHPSNLPMNQASIWIKRADNFAIVRSGAYNFSPAIGSSALPGTLFSIPASVVGGALPPGSYVYQVAGRASDLQYGPASDPRSFVVNSPPTTPSNLQPPSGAVSTTIPLLEWNIDDPDTDDVMGVDADSQIEIVRPNGTTVSVVTLQYDPDTGKGWYQPSGADFSAFGTYKWRVRGRDTSAGAFGIGAWSSYQTIIYSSGPVVTITAPELGENEGSARPTVAFSIASGNISRYEVKLYAVDAALAKNSSGEVTLDTPAPSTEYTFPAGWVRNFNDYDLEVTVWDTLNEMGRSLRWPFHVEFDPGPPLDEIEASPIAERRDPENQTSAVLLSWAISGLNPQEFAGYNIYRRAVTDAPEDAVLLRTLTAMGQTRWRDYWAPPGKLLIYGVSQLQRVGVGDAIDVVESEILEVQAELNLLVPVLNSVYDPSLRFPVMWLSDGMQGRTERPKASYVTWGSQNKATTITTPAEFDTRTVELEINLRSDARGTLYDHIHDWEELVRSGHPVCYRPQRAEEFMYAEIEDWSWSRGEVGVRRLSVSLKEIDFTPGSAGGS